LRLAEPNKVYAEDLRTKVNENMSIFPEEEVGAGVTPAAHFIVTALPLIVNVDGIYPVEP
jgi:hypothetical protein